MPIFQDAKGKNISNFQKMIDEKKNTIRKYYDEIGHLGKREVKAELYKLQKARSCHNGYCKVEGIFCGNGT